MAGDSLESILRYTHEILNIHEIRKGGGGGGGKKAEGFLFPFPSASLVENLGCFL